MFEQLQNIRAACIAPDDLSMSNIKTFFIHLIDSIDPQPKSTLEINAILSKQVNQNNFYSELNNISEKCLAIKRQLLQSINAIQQMHTASNEQLWRTIDQGRQAVRIIRQCVEQNKVALTDSQSSLQGLREKIKVINKRLQIHEKTLQNLQKDHFSDFDSNLNSALDWVDEKCYCFHFLKFHQASITTHESKINIFSKNFIHNNYETQILLNKIHKGAYIGIIDSKYNSKSQISNDDYVIYYGNKGEFWDGKNMKEKQGRGFKEGEIIKVKISYSEGKIQWIIDQQIIHSYLGVDLFLSQQINWVPFISLNEQQDKITIIE